MERDFDVSKIKVAVGLSGGVDSSVAALLLRQAGFDVTGVYLKCYWTHHGCQADLDRVSAAKVASFLDIPFEIWDFEKEYREKVIEYFYREYQRGATPNPDVVCNREIKFGLFLQEATKKREFHFIATGHYAGSGLQDQRSKVKDQNGWIFPFSYQKITEGDNRDTNLVVEPEYFDALEMKGKNRTRFDTYYNGPSIFGGVDEKKDQSYFLYDIDEKAIEHSLYPLFGLLKSQVRQMAVANNLPTANRPDSQGICFIGEVNIEKFLKERIPESRGEVVDVQGRVIGEHKGVPFYTIGQRHGFQINSVRVSNSSLVDDSDSVTLTQGVPPDHSIGVPPQRSLKHMSSPFNSMFASAPILTSPANHYKGPLYVIGKDVKRNRLVVGAGEECKREAFAISKFKSQSSNLNLKSEKLFVRIRHLGELIPCEIRLDFGACDLEVILAYPVFGVAPGQSAVFYRRLSRRERDPAQWRWQVTNYQLPTLFEVVGGGIIE